MKKRVNVVLGFRFEADQSEMAYLTNLTTGFANQIKYGVDEEPHVLINFESIKQSDADMIIERLRQYRQKQAGEMPSVSTDEELAGMPDGSKPEPGPDPFEIDEIG